MMVHRTNRRSMKLSLIAALACSAAWPGMAAAQSAASASPPADENVAPADATSGGDIVVTAQRRSERLQDVPISISVLGGTELDRSRASGLSEMLSRVPGLVTQRAQGGNTVLAVRGVSSFTNIYRGTSTTALYVDSVPFGFVKSGFLPDLSLYDLGRVEVLRGPQGTLYGASALNGVVRVLTADADPAAFDLKGRMNLSHTQHGSPSARGDVAINIPLIEDRLAIRAVVGQEIYGGWIDTPNGADVNDLSRSTVRVKLNAVPSDDLTVGLSYWRSRTSGGGSDSAVTQYTDTSPVNRPSRGGFEVYGGKIGYELPFMAVTSQTSYIDYNQQEVTDPLIGASARAVAGLPYQNYMLLTRTTSRVFAQELSLNSRNTGSWRWSAGGFYRTAKDNLYQQLAAALPNPVNFDDRSESYAVFGEITKQLFDGRLELTAGLRYFHDHVQQIEKTRFGTNTAVPLIHYSADFERVTPRGVITWHPDRNMTIYASYGEGFRSGYGQNIIALTTNPNLPPVRPDTLRNYEIGAKGRLLDGLIEYDLAAYYMKWQDIMQDAALIYNGVQIAGVVNGKSASGPGVDAALTLRPTPYLAINGTASWNGLKTDSIVLNGARTVLNKGDRIQNSAELTLGGGVDYTVPLGEDRSFKLSSSFTYLSKFFDTVPRVGTALVYSGDNLLFVRGALTLALSKNFQVSLFGENLTNEKGAQHANSRGPAGLANGPFRDNERLLRPRPRTIGLELEYRM